MQNHKATIFRDDKMASLVLSVGEVDYRIPLTHDSPNETKIVFNKLIVELKKGKFEFTLEDQTEDLYYHICYEYIKQLNSEIADVYSHLKKNNLTIPSDQAISE